MIDGQLGAKDVEISDSTPERRAPQVWSNEENNILALLTHCQLGLLPKNDSTLYQWHWERISSIMKQCGFDRNPRGCQMAWNRYVKPGANYGGPRNFYFDPTTLTGQSVQNGFDDLGKFLIRNFQYIDNDLNRLWLAGKAVELLEERGAPSARRE
jgi:hypothetical protein